MKLTAMVYGLKKKKQEKREHSYLFLRVDGRPINAQSARVII